MSNNKPTIYLVGETHGSKKVANVVEPLLKRCNIDLILSEGFDFERILKREYVLKYPFLIYSLLIYKIILHILGAGIIFQ
jgi:hypothetical protein